MKPQSYGQKFRGKLAVKKLRGWGEKEKLTILPGIQKKIIIILFQLGNWLKFPTQGLCYVRLFLRIVASPNVAHIKKNKHLKQLFGGWRWSLPITNFGSVAVQPKRGWLQIIVRFRSCWWLINRESWHIRIFTTLPAKLLSFQTPYFRASMLVPSNVHQWNFTRIPKLGGSSQLLSG